MGERPTDLRDPEHPYWMAPRGVWLARTWTLRGPDGTTQPHRAPSTLPDLCECKPDRQCQPTRCACAGRLDLDDVPAECCAHYNTPERVTKAGRRW